MFTDISFSSVKALVQEVSLKDWLLIAIFVMGVCSMATGFWWLFESTQGNDEATADITLTDPEPIATPDSKPELLTVEVSGAVKTPGIYHLPLESRVAQALEVAGGTTQDASQLYLRKELNLASKIADEEKIYIPFQGEFLGATAPEHTPDVQHLTTGTTPTQKGVSLNQATQAELETLNGVGEKRASDIIQNRPYATIDELLSRQVIPQSLFDKIKNKVTL